MYSIIRSNSCWCGESASSSYYSGKWFFGTNDYEFVDAQLVKCLKCGQVRTLSVKYANEANISLAPVYSGLSYRHMRSLRTIKRYARPGSVLDIGCNSGEILNFLSKNCPILNSFAGIDRDMMAISVNLNSNIKLQACELQSVNCIYDNIFALHTLEHINELTPFIKKIRDISKPSTIIYIAVPAIDSRNAIRDMALWGALNPIEHIWHFDKNSLKSLISYFIPNAKILYFRHSFVWPDTRFPSIISEILYKGDQIELVLERGPDEK
jgi:SAM-dependent methyltransferase